MVHCVAVAGIEICVGVDAIRGLFRWAVDKRSFEITLICVSECGNVCLGFRISEMFVRVRLCFSAACLFFQNVCSSVVMFFWRALFFLISEMVCLSTLIFSGGRLFFFKHRKCFPSMLICFCSVLPFSETWNSSALLFWGRACFSMNLCFFWRQIPFFQSVLK